MNTYKLGLFALLIIAFTACEPQLADKSELGPLPTPSFEILPGNTPNDFVLVNTSENTFLTQWNLGDNPNTILEGNEVTANYPAMGEYIITMTAFGQGGSASTSKIVTVEQDAPLECDGNMIFLTGCGTKTWRLANEANALHVGPNIVDTWWGNSIDDIAARPCLFNDEYIFSYYNGTYEYDNKGDFWADDDGSGNVSPADLGVDIGCHPSSTWPSQYQAWDSSNTHTFNITDNQLTVTGLGAHIGLYKIGTSGEVSTPQESVSFNIYEISDSRMILFAHYGSVVWRVTLTSD